MLDPNGLASTLLRETANYNRGKRWMSKQAKVEIDLHDTLQPLALLKVNQALRRMSAGDRLEIRGADPSTFEALLRLLPEKRFRVAEADVQPTGYHIRLTCQPNHETDFDPAADTTRHSERKPK
jgi:TusA-related sulfurtransferase